MAKKRTKRQPIKAVGRSVVHGSTRYSSKNTHTKRKAPRIKSFVTRSASAGVGAAAGSALGAAGGYVATGYKTGAVAGAHAGKIPGAVVGGHVGARISAKRGYSRRTKQRMSLRAIGSGRAKPDAPYNNAKQGKRSANTSATKSKSRVTNKGRARRKMKY